MGNAASKLERDRDHDAQPSLQQVRQRIREGHFRSHTSGLAADRVQGNVVILPAEHASDFMRYCQRNPKPCPLLAVSEPGDARLPALGDDIDIRTDVPLYRVFRYGELVEEVTDIRALWTKDSVAFVLGCSFSFESALLDAGVPLRHITDGKNVAMYRTSLETSPAGVFSGPMVVSMRPMRAAAAIKTVQITSRFAAVHGAPVHLGDPALIGISELQRPDYGDPVRIEPDELPVFHACGVTPQAAIGRAKLPICITHAPGAMLITDRLNNELASF